MAGLRFWFRGESLSTTLETYYLSVLVGFWAAALVQLAANSLVVRTALTVLALAGASSYPTIGAALFHAEAPQEWMLGGLVLGAMAFVAAYLSAQRPRPKTLEAALRVNGR